MWVAGIFAVLVGFVSAGFVGSLWAGFAGETPGFRALGVRDGLLPLRALAVVLHAPMAILKHGSELATAGHLVGVPIIFAAAGWCFLQGVFILAVVFRVG